MYIKNLDKLNLMGFFTLSQFLLLPQLSQKYHSIKSGQKWLQPLSLYPNCVTSFMCAHLCFSSEMRSSVNGVTHFWRHTTIMSNNNDVKHYLGELEMHCYFKECVKCQVWEGVWNRFTCSFVRFFETFNISPFVMYPSWFLSNTLKANSALPSALYLRP